MSKTRVMGLRVLVCSVVVCSVAACSSAGDAGGDGSGDQGLGIAGSGGVGAGSFAGAGGASAGANGAPLAGTSSAAGTSGALPVAGMTAPPVAGTTAPPVAGSGALPTAGMSAPPPVDPPATPVGSEDGDPSAPIVSAPNVACGPNSSLFGLTSTNVEIGGRGVHVSYPCNKHAGAPVTFVLNLHGTMPNEDFKLYQVAYFSINEHADSHNLITAAPKAIGSQWGNGDGGADLPHIMAVIDWVYTTFADFDIRGMWVAGHSWGAMYSTTFACRAELADKVKGVVLQSGSGTNPACASQISVISSAAEDDIGPVIDQGTVPAGHGCGAPQMSMVGNNEETYWPGCNPGFAHANYFMLGKAHADYMDAEVVQRIADSIKAARQ